MTTSAAPKKTRKLIKKLLESEAIVQIFKRLKKANPDPRTELDYTNPYTLLVAVTLSAQMTDTGVNRATRDLFPLTPTPQDMLRLGEDKLMTHIAGVNFHRTKAKNVLAQAKMLAERFDGVVPKHYDDLISLPGVGNKTAKVVLNEIFGAHTIAVDTHVFRVSNRLGLSDGNTPEAVEADLLRVVPKPFQRRAHHWLLLHGRYVCKARMPECWRCPLADVCLYRDKVLVAPKSRRKT